MAKKPSYPRVGGEYYYPAEEVRVRVTKIVYDQLNDEWEVHCKTRDGEILFCSPSDLIQVRKHDH